MAVGAELAAMIGEEGAARTLRLTLDPGWLTITLDRPQARNALSQDMIAELMRVFTAAAADPGIRGISLRGGNRVFCAGGDLKDMDAMKGGRDAIAALSRTGGNLFTLIDRCPKVVLALVDGPAMAGGLGLACAADIVVVTRAARMALSEVRLGLVAAQIAPYLLRRCGPSLTRRLMLTAARLDGEEALRLGIADMLAEDEAALDRQEAALRDQVLCAAPGALAATKALLQQLEGSDAAAGIEAAAEIFAEALGGAEAREGLAAFAEKRPPRWAPR